MSERAHKKILLWDGWGDMASTLTQRVALRYAKQLAKGEFDKLIQWLGPKAMEAHQRFPRGMRSFDTRTRVLRFNIDPTDYLNYNVEKAKAMMSEGATLMDVVNPKAYKAMKAVLETLRRRRLKFKMVKVSWGAGGSYVEAVLPQPKNAPQEPEVDPRTWMG